MTADEFLLARISEEEKVWMTVAIAPRQLGKTHARKHLRECDAKRRIVERIQQRRQRANVTTTMLEILLDLAAVYSDHPDYREEWRP